MTTYQRSLQDIRLSDLPTCGGKAARLGESMRLGCPVPPGVVLTTELYARFMRQGGLQGEVASILNAMQPAALHQFQAAEWAIQAAFRVRRVPRDVREAILAALAEVGQMPVVVRSSPAGKNDAEQSFVGLHNYYQYVNSEDAVVAAVVGCWMSLYSAKAMYYAHRFGVDTLHSEMAVLVQGLANTTMEGTLFTVDPLSGSPDQFLVETREGERRDLFRIDAYDRQSADTPLIADLREAALRLDEHFGSYQVIEWGVADDRLTLLRVRPATCIPRFLPVTVRSEDASRGPLGLVVASGQDPRQLRPFSWYHRSRTRAARAAYFASVSRPFSAFSGRDDYYLRGYLYSRWRRFPFSPGEPLGTPSLARAAWLLAHAGRLDREFRTLWRVRRPRLLELAAVDRTGLSDERLGKLLAEVQGIVEDFLEESGRVGEAPQVLADIVRQLHQAWVGDPAQSGELLYTGADQRLRDERKLDRALTEAADDDAREGIYQAHLRDHGHQYLRGNPIVDGTDIIRLRVNEGALREVFKRAVRGGADGADAAHKTRLARRDALEAETLGPLSRVRRLIYRYALQVARRYEPLASDRWEPALLGLLLEHSVVMEVGRRLVERSMAERVEDAALLGNTELLDMLAGASDSAYVERVIRERRVLIRRWQRYTPPETLDGAAGARAGVDVAIARSERALVGRAVSPGTATGRAHIVRSLGEATDVLPGEVLVCPEALFELSPLFGTVAAVVTEAGGLLDHAATLVREYKVPAVFGVERATSLLIDGQRIVVDADSGLVTPLDTESEWAAL